MVCVYVCIICFYMSVCWYQLLCLYKSALIICLIDILVASSRFGIAIWVYSSVLF